MRVKGAVASLLAATLIAVLATVTAAADTSALAAKKCVEFKTGKEIMGFVEKGHVLIQVVNKEFPSHVKGYDDFCQIYENTMEEQKEGLEVGRIDVDKLPEHIAKRLDAINQDEWPKYVLLERGTSAAIIYPGKPKSVNDIIGFLTEEIQKAAKNNNKTKKCVEFFTAKEIMGFVEKGHVLIQVHKEFPFNVKGYDDFCQIYENTMEEKKEGLEVGRILVEKLPKIAQRFPKILKRLGQETLDAAINQGEWPKYVLLERGTTADDRPGAAILYTGKPQSVNDIIRFLTEEIQKDNNEADDYYEDEEALMDGHVSSSPSFKH
jgi:uncharacterized protein YeaO (DUF488 family)